MSTPQRHVHRYLRTALLHIATMAVTFPLAIGVLCLLGWQISVLVENKTTVEHHEGVTAHAHYCELGQSFKHPYDVGCGENCRQVLGRRCAVWLWPEVAAAGDGLRFPNCLPPVAAAAQRGSSESSALLAGPVQLTDRKRESYADQL